MSDRDRQPADAHRTVRDSARQVEDTLRRSGYSRETARKIANQAAESAHRQLDRSK